MTESLPIFLYPDEQMLDRPGNKRKYTNSKSDFHICSSAPKLSPEPALARLLFYSEFRLNRALQTLKNRLSPFFWAARGRKARIRFSSTGLLID